MWSVRWRVYEQRTVEHATMIELVVAGNAALTLYLALRTAILGRALAHYSQALLLLLASVDTLNKKVGADE